MDNNNTIRPFTHREEQVADCLAKGYSEKEVADALGISFNTVNNHIRNIKEKNHLNKNSEIILRYIAYKKKKPFDLRRLREYGVTILLVFLNVCTISNGGGS